MIAFIYFLYSYIFTYIYIYIYICHKCFGIYIYIYTCIYILFVYLLYIIIRGMSYICNGIFIHPSYNFQSIASWRVYSASAYVSFARSLGLALFWLVSTLSIVLRSCASLLELLVGRLAGDIYLSTFFVHLFLQSSKRPTAVGLAPICCYGRGPELLESLRQYALRWHFQLHFRKTLASP